MTTSIEWTEETWNPLVGCSRVSEGCRNCYAERVVHRGLSPQHVGLTKVVNGRPGWTGTVAFVESALEKPLRWKKPRRIFVNSLSDLFHEAVPDEWIDRIFAVMANSDRHTYQVLTKRPQRMKAYLTRRWKLDDIANHLLILSEGQCDMPGWPLPNLWLGVSVEDQATADERIPLLLQTPAAVRWVSYEPALGPVDFQRERRFLKPLGMRGLDWIVVGGESGPGARPFDIGWARQTIRQTAAAGVPVFLKQIGSHPHNEAPSGRMFCWAPGGLRGCGAGSWSRTLVRADRKGGDMAEWPLDLHVREYPACQK